MKSFYSLYYKALKAAIDNKIEEEFSGDKLEAYDPHHLDCLFNPDIHPPVWRIDECQCSEEEKEACLRSCFFDALEKDERGNIVVSQELCTGCGDCVLNCKEQNLVERKELLPIFDLLHRQESPVYAMIAPAFISQFSEAVTPGKLRNAFKKLGFAGMIEVALFADILTLKEALEFDRLIKDDQDILLSSCCCPIWIAMIRKVYKQLIPHIPPSVSPMVACGRSIKRLNPGAITVFVGPCIAKKAEAKEPDIKDAVDYVLTFQEVQDMFEIAAIDPREFEDDMRDHSSTGGRIYARTGGVSEAVQRTLDKLVPDRSIALKAQQGNGAAECKKLLNKVLSGEIKANFIEGMGCVGGCVGGPKAILSKEEGTKHVNRYGSEAIYGTPAENPYVMELLQRLGYDTIESLLEKDRMFTREFN